MYGILDWRAVSVMATCRSVSAFPRIDENEALGNTEPEVGKSSRLSGVTGGASIRRQLFSEQGGSGSGSGSASVGGTSSTSPAGSWTAADACPPQTPTSKAPGPS